MTERGFCGDGFLGGNWVILFFILVFLLLFWGRDGFGVDLK